MLPELSMCASIKLHHHVKPDEFSGIGKFRKNLIKKDYNIF